MFKKGFGLAIRGARVALAVAMAGVASIATATSAQATPIDLFGTVTLTQNGSNVFFDIVLSDPYRFVETADGGGALFLFNDTVSGSTITNISATLDGTPLSIPGGLSGFINLSPFVVAGFGTFTALVECTDPTSCVGEFAPAINDLHFTVTNATIANLTIPNDEGNLFIASVSTPVPEPATLSLLALGLGLGARRRIRR